MYEEYVSFLFFDLLRSPDPPGALVVFFVAFLAGALPAGALEAGPKIFINDKTISQKDDDKKIRKSVNQDEFTFASGFAVGRFGGHYSIVE